MDMGSIYTAVLSPDGKTIAAGYEDKSVKLWDTATGTLKRNLTGHTGEVIVVDVSFFYSKMMIEMVFSSL